MSLTRITCTYHCILYRPVDVDRLSNSRAQYAVLQYLGVQKIYTAIGFSMGGQQAYYWATMYPDYVERQVLVHISFNFSLIVLF